MKNKKQKKKQKKCGRGCPKPANLDKAEEELTKKMPKLFKKKEKELREKRQKGETRKSLLAKDESKTDEVKSSVDVSEEDTHSLIQYLKKIHSLIQYLKKINLQKSLFTKVFGTKRRKKIKELIKKGRYDYLKILEIFTKKYPNAIDESKLYENVEYIDETVTFDDGEGDKTKTKDDICKMYEKILVLC